MRNLGASHHGVTDWYWQRVSAIALLILLPGAVLVLLNLYAGTWSQQDLLNWLDQGWVRVLHSVLLLALLQHAFLGVKVIVEDYVHVPGVRVLLMVVLLIAALLLGLTWMAFIWGWG